MEEFSERADCSEPLTVTWISHFP